MTALIQHPLAIRSDCHEIWYLVLLLRRLIDQESFIALVVSTRCLVEGNWYVNFGVPNSERLVSYSFALKTFRFAFAIYNFSFYFGGIRGLIILQFNCHNDLSTYLSAKCD